MIDVALLKRICETPGAPGFEDPIRNLVLDELKGLVDDIQVNNLGNVIARKKGSGDKKLMVAAHMDEISFIVTHIDDDGFVRFHTLGGFDPKTLTAQRVIIHGKQDILGVMGSKPVHVMSPEERTKAPLIKDYYIDTGYAKSELEKYVSVGNPITRERQLVEMGDCVNSKSLDNRISVFMLLEALKKLKDREIPCDLYAVFTVQEEVGIRGAMNTAHQINPDYGIALDVTVAYDLPGAQPHEMITKLGHGTAIKIMDSSVISDQRMVSYLKSQADKNEIPWQAEILTGGGTDAAGLQRGGKIGAITGAISVPTRHLHQVIEMAHKSDISHSIELLVLAISNLDNFQWERPV